MQKKQLCKIPQVLQFEYYPQQQLHAFIDIQNLTDQIVSFKIKTTAPIQYLVKPMEGQIYKKQKAKIIFKRKKLSLQNYQANQNGTKPLKQRFMFIVTCKSKNPIGIQKIDQASYLMNVKFVSPTKSYQEASPVKKVKKAKTNQQKKQQTQLLALIQVQRQKLEQLKRQTRLQQTKINTMQNNLDNTNQSIGSLISGQLNKENLICLMVICLLLGLML